MQVPINTDRAWIQTYTNKKFHILDPQPEDICIEDIAHALAMQCRFTGHTRHHYSVAQHAYYASLIVAPGFEFEALNHDDSEAYLCDMNRPMKHYTTAGAEYMKVESVIEHAIARKLGLPLTMSPEVKVADNAMLYAEKAQLMPAMEWDTRWSDKGAADIKIHKWTEEEAEERFLGRYYHLLIRGKLK
jgi:uncharacterized protein